MYKTLHVISHCAYDLNYRLYTWSICSVPGAMASSSRIYNVMVDEGPLVKEQLSLAPLSKTDGVNVIF